MKSFLIISVIVLSSASSFAQTQGSSFAYANWDFGFPVGNNFVSSFSGWGGNVGFSYFVQENLGVGLELGWNSYYQYASTKTYSNADGAVTTDLYKYIFTLPITATVMHTFKAGKVVRPYVKLGLGAQFSQQNLYYNIYQTTNDDWGFVAIPEVGANLRFSPYSKWSMNLSVRYKFSTNSQAQYNLTNIQTLNFNVGVVAQIR
jgi:outer membrane protein W